MKTLFTPWIRGFEPTGPDLEADRAARYRGLFVGLAVLVFMCITLDHIGLTWDEPLYFGKQYRIDRWYRKLFGRAAERQEALSAKGMQEAWAFCHPPPHENPPIYAVLSHATWRATRWLWGDLRGHRLAPALLYSIVAGMIYSLAWRHWGTLPAISATGAWVFNPRVFAHGHLATTDMTMTAFWFFAAVAFYRSCIHRRKAWLFGPLVGLAIMSKFTGVLAVPPQLVWSFIYRQGYAIRIFAWAALLTPVVMLLCHPGWWPDPVGGVMGAIEIHRTRHEIQQVPTMYLGDVYRHSLPWHNTIILTVACVPAAWLVLDLCGLVLFLLPNPVRVSVPPFGSEMIDPKQKVEWSRKDEPDEGNETSLFGGWIILNWLTLMIIRATPIAPGHDGIRQFVGAFPYFALLAGYGFWRISLLLRRFFSDQMSLVAAALILAGALGSAVNGWWRIRPYELSFYSGLIGGLPGAQRIGLETSYYWDAAGWEMLEQLNKLPPGSVIEVPPAMDNFTVYQEWGYLRKDLVFVQSHQPRVRPPDYYLMVVREGMLTDAARELLKRPPVYAVTRQGVTLAALIQNPAQSGTR